MLFGGGGGSGGGGGGSGRVCVCGWLVHWLVSYFGNTRD